MSPQQLSVEASRVNRDHHALSVVGELDLTTAPTLVDAVRALLAQSARRIALDLGDLTFVDSTGLHALFAANQLCETRRCDLAVTRASRQVRLLFSIAGVDGLAPP